MKFVKISEFTSEEKTVGGAVLADVLLELSVMRPFRRKLGPRNPTRGKSKLNLSDSKEKMTMEMNNESE